METTPNTVIHDLRDLNAEELELAPERWGNKAAAAGTALWKVSRATYDQLAEAGAAGAQATDRAIRENPYRSLGIAAGAGFLIGMLLTRR